jgi:hypothetical protein
MLISSNSSAIVVSNHMKKRRRRLSLYFLSSKALRRSRMNRGKRFVSKTSQATPGRPRKVLSYGGGSTTGEEDVEVQNLECLQEMTKDTISIQNISRDD